MTASDDEAFLEDCLVRWLTGGDATATALDRLCAARPHLQPRLRELAALAEGLPGAGGDDPLLGQRLGNRYRLTARLGAGGMSLVYRAHDEQLDREVAVKVLDDLFARDADRVARLRREAHHLAALQHPHIVAVHDFDLSGRPPFLVMDYVDGCDLAALIGALRARTPADGVPRTDEVTGVLAQLAPAAGSAALSPTLRQLAQEPWPRTVAELGMQMAAALAAAHAVGVVHRDVKPSNFMLDRQGRVRLLDFGLARRSADATLTQSHARLGTPLYMAPEQVRGEEAGPLSDVYSLGASLHELACLQPPFVARGSDLDSKILYDDPAPAHTLRPRLPRDLSAICMKAMAKAPAQRYANAQALHDDLARFARFEPPSVRLRAWPAPLRRAVGTYRRYRRGLVAAALTVVVAALGAVIAGLALGDHRASAGARRRAQALALHATLSPYVGFGGGREDRLADTQRPTTLLALDRLLDLDPTDDVARVLRAWVRGEEDPPPPCVAQDLAVLRDRLGDARVQRLYGDAALALQRRDRNDGARGRAQVRAAWQALAGESQPFDAPARRLALTVLLQLVEVDPDDRANHVAAMKPLLDAEEATQPTAFSHMARGVICMVERRLVRAAEAFLASDRLCPNQPATLHALARVHRLLGHPELAQPFAAAALGASATPHINYLEQYVLVAIELGDFVAAEAALARWPAHAAKAPQVLLLRARLLLQRAALGDGDARAADLAACRTVVDDLHALVDTGQVGAGHAAATQRYAGDLAALASDDLGAQADVLRGLLLDPGGRGMADPLNAHLLRRLSDVLQRAGETPWAKLFAQQADALDAAAVLRGHGPPTKSTIAPDRSGAGAR